MTARFNLALSDDLNRDIDLAVEENQTTKSDVMRKALMLYLEAQKAKKAGLKLGLVDPKTDMLKTEFIGL